MREKGSMGSSALALNPSEWDLILGGFEDANFYQGSAYGIAHHGEGRIQHLVLRNGVEVVAAAQVALLEPGFGVRIAYIGSGPLWKRKGKGKGFLREILSSLKEEYVRKRGMGLVVVPRIFDLDREEFSAALTAFGEEGFSRRKTGHQTFLLDLSPTEEELTRGMRRKWRQSLGYAKKKGFQIEEGPRKDLLLEGLSLFQAMKKRKGFSESADLGALPRTFDLLGSEDKTETLVLRLHGIPHAVLSWSLQGDTCIPLVAATSEEGIRSGASYLAWWELIVRVKGRGGKRLDLGGINREKNPGGYIFKSGMVPGGGPPAGLIGEFFFHPWPGGKRFLVLASQARCVLGRFGHFSAILRRGK